MYPDRRRRDVRRCIFLAQLEKLLNPHVLIENYAICDDVDCGDEDAQSREPSVEGGEGGVTDLEDRTEAASFPAKGKDERQHRKRNEACDGKKTSVLRFWTRGVRGEGGGVPVRVASHR